VTLYDIAHSRAGDKGTLVNCSVIAYDRRDFDYLVAVVTAEAVRAHLRGLIEGDVVRYLLPSLGAMNFVMSRPAGNSVTRTLALDAHGKSMSSALLEMPLPDHVLQRSPTAGRRGPPLPTAIPTVPLAVLPLRLRHREELRCQIVHDSIHRRGGWATTYLLRLDDVDAGFATVAIGGPWTGKPTIIEFHVLPAYRHRAFALFECLLEGSGASLMEIQSNDTLLAVMLHTYARDIWSEKIVFRDGVTTALEANGARLQQLTPDHEVHAAIAARQGGTEWHLQSEGQTVATGGLMFHYNVPYGDIYMEVAEPFRRRGLGAYLVQEMKRIAYELGAIPCARCSPENVPSRLTLQKAGLVPYAHILNGTIKTQ
jgi:GNAT superfamily N-acetyltransferase